jgi:hypothetical protein
MRRLREAGDTVGTVIVHPDPHFVKEVAQELLALADNPMHVEYVMWPEPGFRIPEELLDRFEKHQGGKDVIVAPEIVGDLIEGVLTNLTAGGVPVVFEVPQEVADLVGEPLTADNMPVAFEVPAEVVEAVKRKPGRPKKNTEGQ